MRLNGDTGNNYSYVQMGSDGTVYSFAGTHGFIYGSGNDTPANGIALVLFNIMDYSATDKHKTILSRSNDKSGDAVWANANRWASTNAVTSIEVYTGTARSYTSATTVTLYGIVS
jgi:hypothetical protein